MMGLLALLFLAGLATPWFHRAWGERTAARLAFLPAAAFAYFLFLGFTLHEGHTPVASLPWIPDLGLEFSLYLDGLGLLFALLITGIGAFVVWYAGAYLHDDPARHRFLCALLLFMASMLGVVLSDNLITLFVFWELTSFTSYLLIGHNHREEKARKAALQALLVTGMGGLVLLAGLLLLGEAAGTYSLSILTTQTGLADHPLFTPALLLIFIGVFTKSAQVPFHFWLPNAMQAPTPASAYLHSSTMVKAGVFLLARLHPVGAESDIWTPVVTTVGALTLVTGAVMAYGQTYLKSLLAYTTVAALGGITMLLGFGHPAAVKAAVVFLLAHALYKASLFLIAGIIDHETGEKNIEKLGGLRSAMPRTAIAGLLVALSMMGLPPFFGFLGKELLYAADTSLPITLAALLGGIFFFVVAYRTGIKPFVGVLRPTPRHPHEAPLAMWSGPMTLAALGLLFGLASPLVGHALVAPASSAILGEEIQVKLTLWHGINRELLLSLLTLALGLGALAAATFARPYLPRLAPLARFGPERGYQGALDLLNLVAKTQTRFFQNGYLRIYIEVILAFILLTAGLHFLHTFTAVSLPALTPVRFNDAVIVLIIILSIIGAVGSRSRMAAIASLGVTGYAVALLFVLYSAPDLAMTQLVIETLTVILIVLAFYHLPPFRSRTTGRAQIRDILVAGAVGVFFAALTLLANVTNLSPPISRYFSEQSWASAYGKNVVNVILVDFRAIDTLGEIAVLVLAGIGAVALLSLKMGKSGSAPNIAEIRKTEAAPHTEEEVL
ncbi:MAG TPA: putative monovalent cation/H+ antiporter subunit A [Kiritimatiellia bacterium]|nr:putative monovalent cation/H+ antiporter subunit A [Kiritimatiellia bacterium]